MTDHEKRIRALLDYHANSQCELVAADKADLRALLADLDEARAALTAAKAGGWVAVPVEPTPKMVENGTLCVGQTGAITRSIYAAMLAARPTTPPKEKA